MRWLLMLMVLAGCNKASNAYEACVNYYETACDCEDEEACRSNVDSKKEWADACEEFKNFKDVSTDMTEEEYVEDQNCFNQEWRKDCDFDAALEECGLDEAR